MSAALDNRPPLECAPPSESDSRSRLADWLEYQAVLGATIEVSFATLSNAFDLESDAAVVPREFGTGDTDELFDNSIADIEREHARSRLFDELEFRARVLGDAYPFALDMRASTLRLDSLGSADEAGRMIYIFCLLTSLFRRGLLQPRKLYKDLEGQIPNCFQICSCVAAGGFTEGEVASFGFPRVTGDDFLPALKKAYVRFGYGSVRDVIPPGFDDSVKDGGIDVIAWRDHPDQWGGKFYVIGQCASGENWKSKSVNEFVKTLHIEWFATQPARFFWPCMFIPFCLYDEIEDDENYHAAVKNKHWVAETKFGTVFDRLRLAYYAHRCQLRADAFAEKVEGYTLLGQVGEWNAAVIAAAKGTNNGQ